MKEGRVTLIIFQDRQKERKDAFSNRNYETTWKKAASNWGGLGSMGMAAFAYPFGVFLSVS